MNKNLIENQIVILHTHTQNVHIKLKIKIVCHFLLNYIPKKSAHV